MLRVWSKRTEIASLNAKRCLSCDEGHRTLANSCMRKEAIKKTREEAIKEEERKEMAIKRVAEQTAKQTIAATQNA